MNKRERMMEKRRIGSLEVSVVGLGCNNFGWRLDAERTAAVVNAAIDAGINFFDTADIYGAGESEEFIGRALKGRRSDILIATKFGKPMDAGRGGSPEYIRRAVEASLTRLGTDVIDLYQIHEPDPAVPIEETLGALGDLVREGKVREIGCSNFSADQLDEAARKAPSGEPRFASVQNEYSLIHREPEMEVLPACERLNLAFIPYFPLASGLLTGKYRKDAPMPEQGRLVSGSSQSRLLTDRNLDLVEKLIAFAAERNHTILELAFAWLLAKRPVASVIAGATKPEQVHANARAAGWRLSDDEVERVSRQYARPIES
jgi:aryl-alcohol dehydrogenase-like predicted oxidoreductase